MNDTFKKIKTSNPVRFLASIRITVVCLSLLFVLTFGGTVAQVAEGLYLAQQKYFYSFGFLAFGWLPFPGGQLVMWVLFINLCAASLTRFVLSWKYLGIWITHLGLLLYFVAAYVVFQQTTESNLTLVPGETKNLSSAYHKWELSIWEPQSSEEKIVTGVSDEVLKHGRELKFDTLPFRLFIHTYFKNAQAYTAGPEEDITEALNGSEIKFLEPVKINTEPEENIPGIVFAVTADNSGKPVDIILYGAENKPTKFISGDAVYNFQLRRRRYELPVTFTLNKFEKEFYPGTQTPKSFRSYVTVSHDGAERDIEIYMNHPYRFKDYTFYQASYGVDGKAREFSTFAVVRNSGRLLPYIASGVTFLGLVVHFLLMVFKKPGRNEKAG